MARYKQKVLACCYATSRGEHPTKPTKKEHDDCHLRLSKRLYPELEWRAWTIKLSESFKSDGTTEARKVIVSGGGPKAQQVLMDELRTRHSFTVDEYEQGRLAVG